MTANANRRQTLVGQVPAIADVAIDVELGEPDGVGLERTSIADADSANLLAASPLGEQPA